MKKSTRAMVSLILSAGMLFTVGCSCNEEPAGNSSSSGGGATVEEQKQMAFIDSIGGVSETYVSGVSEEKYDSNAKAAEAYVQEQVVGAKAATIVNTTSKGTLNQTEIAALKIPAAESEGIQSVEKIEVEYSESEGAGVLPMAAASTETKTVEVYIIKYPNYFKYYTPCPVNGQTINKSYYDSVFDADKYANCTLSSTLAMNMNMASGTESIYMQTTATQIVKYTANAIYLEQTTTSTADIGDGAETVDMTMCAYIVQTGDTITCHVKMTSNSDPTDNIDWTEGDLTTIGFGDLEELAPFADQYLDYSYFTKTNYGFELSGENAQQYITETLDLAQVTAFLGNSTMDMFAKYYVSGGVLSGMRMDLSMNIDVKQDGESVTGSVTEVVETKVTNYGTTTVTKPF